MRFLGGPKNNLVTLSTEKRKKHRDSRMTSHMSLAPANEGLIDLKIGSPRDKIGFPLAPEGGGAGGRPFLTPQFLPLPS